MNGGGTGCGGDEQQMHRLFQNGAARQMQIGAIRHEGGIERAEDGLVASLARK